MQVDLGGRHITSLALHSAHLIFLDSEKESEIHRPLTPDLLIWHLSLLCMTGITFLFISSQGVPSAASPSSSWTGKWWDGSFCEKKQQFFPLNSVPVLVNYSYLFLHD